MRKSFFKSSFTKFFLKYEKRIYIYTMGNTFTIRIDIYVGWERKKKRKREEKKYVWYLWIKVCYEAHFSPNHPVVGRSSWVLVEWYIYPGKASTKQKIRPTIHSLHSFPSKLSPPPLFISSHFPNPTPSLPIITSISSTSPSPQSLLPQSSYFNFFLKLFYRLFRPPVYPTPPLSFSSSSLPSPSY